MDDSKHFTVWESAERKTVAPGTRSNGSVSADHEVIVLGRLQSFHHDEVVGGVGCPVDGRRSLEVVENLIQNDLAITVLPRW